ncbi:MAG: acyl carrier protein [Actinobacteria bacterium]|nr:acyl carrier protein [Actinomycetota bacterium]
MDDIMTRFERILSTTFGVPADDISPDATFESLGMDSLDVVELTLVVEEELGVRIDDEELADVLTVGAAVDRIRTKRAVSA